MNLKNITVLLKIVTLAILMPGRINSFGQTSAYFESNGSVNTSANQADYIRNQYSTRVEAPKEFINGKEYEPYYLRSKSKPLLMHNIKRTASIFTKTRKYTNLELHYDTFLDEVIYTDTSKTINFRFPQIALNDEIIEGFNLYFQNDSMVFRHLRLPECATENLREGFYEIAYEGNSRYIIRHTSSFYVREALNEYKYNPENYMSSSKGFYRIKSKRDLLKLFGDKADEMKKYLHSSRVRIKQAGKDDFISILKHYDSLLTSSR